VPTLSSPPRPNGSAPVGEGTPLSHPEIGIGSRGSGETQIAGDVKLVIDWMDNPVRALSFLIGLTLPGILIVVTFLQYS
jgi:hypothetical protein